MDLQRITGPLEKEWLLIALLLAMAVVLAQWLGHRFVRWNRRRKILRRVHRAGDGERIARGFLEDAGFAIEGAQVAADYDLEVDDTKITISVRADFLVRRGGRRYVVEVKSGAVAPRLQTPGTRRQLLEYQVAFAVDGLLLFDAEAQELHAVTFPSEARTPRGWGGAVFVAVVVLLLAAAYVRAVQP